MTDFLIVGSGIAGACVAQELGKHNVSFHVADPVLRNTSSYISGGIINPITGRKYGLQWNIENLLEAATETYTAFENIVQQPVFKNTQILRLHKSEAALAAWNEKKDDFKNSNWISAFSTLENNAEALHNLFGGVTIHNAMQVYPNALIKGYAAYLQKNNQLISLPFDYNALKISPEYCEWNATQYRHIIFCEGYAAVHNPFLQFLPFKPSKGECITIHIPGFQSEIIIQKDISLVPIGNAIFWVGGTNTWDDFSNTPTIAGLTELENKLRQLLKIPYTILSHSAAVRPAMKDRTPVVGKHLEQSNMYILNGLGTKGFSLAPYYAKALIAHILNNTPMEKNVSAARFIDNGVG